MLKLRKGKDMKQINRAAAQITLLAAAILMIGYGALHLLQPLQNQLVGKLRHNALVAPAGEVRVIHDCLLTIAFVHHIAGREIRLSGKDVHNGFRRIGLELLMLKLQLQSSSPPSSDNCSSSSFCKSSFLGRTVSYLFAKFAHNLSTVSIG